MALESINLRGAGITDETMPYICRLKNLKELELQQCSVTDAGLADLKQLKYLTFLSLINNPQITGAGLCHVAHLSSLEVLRLNEIPQINDNDMVYLSGLKKLTHFETDADTITDAGFVHLSGLSSLGSLSLENAKLTNVALSLLVNLPKLENINLGGDFTDNGLRHLEKLSGLKYLRLSGKGLSVEAIEDFKKKLPSLGYIEAEGALPRSRSLIGRQLREFEGINIQFEPEQAKDKMILICFFDMNQRPSRNCIIQFTKQAEELKQESVVVIAVHTSKVDEGALNEWINKNTIPFTVGMVQGDEGKTRFNWGVRSLPWLILADEKQIVWAEGFGINELDEKITTINEK